MPGLVPGIHVLCGAWRGVNGRDKPGHDAVGPLRAPHFRNLHRLGERGRMDLPQPHQHATGLVTNPTA
ncbi:hypothetical protein EOW77_0025735 [Bradyrhizobium yuanmingense]|nr:hypothetical protein EOW77_0025735 [Bradyrhizobium yuanmingense]